MARDPYERYMEDESDDYQQEPVSPKAPKRRRAGIKKQDVMLLGSFALAAVLLVSVVIMIFSNIVSPAAPSSLPASAVPSGGASVPTPDASASAPLPLAPDTSAWNLRVVGPAYPVDASYSVPELETIAQDSVLYYFDARAIGDLQNMLSACNAVSGHSLKLGLGYRSYTRQQERYAYYYNNYKAMGLSDEEAAARAQEYELPAGQSEHITGLAVDFLTGSVQTPTAEFAQTGEYAWLMEHCAEYGFILRYPQEKESITGVTYKPYHFRWVGVDDAQIIMQTGAVLEEYTGLTSSGGGAAPASSAEPAA